MISAIEALQSRQRVREIAAVAKADERTVRRVLHGDGPKNAAYERVMEAMASTSTEPPPPPVFAKFGELGEREMEFSDDGSSIGIYVLVDPRDQTVRYVGATERASKRLSWHLVDRSSAVKFGWITELRELNLRPTLVVIESSTRESAHLVEEKWISSYLEIGDLYNQKDSGYQFRRQRRLSMERFRGMSFASLASDESFIDGFARVARVRVAAVRSFLSGQEVWPKTYENIEKAAAEIGIVDLPPPAPRASRRPPPRPCPACAAKDAELADLRARVAELEALPHPKPFDHAPGVLHRHYPKAGEPVLCSSVPAPSGGEPPPIPPTMETSAEDSRLAVAPKPPRPAPRPRCHVSLEHEGVDLLAVTTPAEAAG